MTQLALVIDLNVCVGRQACVTGCKSWNTSGSAGALADFRPDVENPTGTFFNRVQTFEVGEFPVTQTVHLPKSCLHCEDPPCVPVCATGASYKRKEDGIVLIDYDKCIGCGYCAWACPYGVRELDEEHQVMTKCALCVDRIYSDALPVADRRPAWKQSRRCFISATRSAPGGRWQCRAPRDFHARASRCRPLRRRCSPMASGLTWIRTPPWRSARWCCA